MKAIGIDLGTTNSLVAVVTDGTPRALPDEHGRAILPSAVFYGPSRVIVGYAARDAAADNPQDTLLSFKRLMGRDAHEVAGDALGTYRLEQEAQVLRVVAGDRRVTPVEASSEILKVLAARASAARGGPAARAVVTVPAYFDDAQRQATRQAARLAGLHVLRLLNEPTAAALAYGLDKRPEGRFAVFDLGGGTFDISLLHLVDGVFEVLSTGGDTRLGGDDIDLALALTMLAEAGAEVDSASPALKRRAIDAAKFAKEALTDHYETDFALLMDDGRRFSRRLSRDAFDEIARPVLDRIGAPCKQALRDAGLRPEALDGVVLVGGSTRSQAVQRFVTKLFGQRPLADIDPDEVVAMGAAIQADLLSAESELRILDGGDVLLLDVTPLSLGLETMGGVVEKVIHRGSQIPASRAQEFTTFKDGQAAMDIHVLQGERELVDDCRSLARFRLDGIPPAAAGLARVRVSFQVDADGILRVSAEETSTGVAQSVTVQPAHGLTDEQVEEMLQASLDHAEADVFERLLRTARVEAERVLIPLKHAMSDDGDLLDAEERTAIEAAIADLEAAAAGDDHRSVQDLTEILDRVSAGFAQRRMDRALHDGLVDRNVDDI